MTRLRSEWTPDEPDYWHDDEMKGYMDLAETDEPRVCLRCKEFSFNTTCPFCGKPTKDIEGMTHHEN